MPETPAVKAKSKRHRRIATKIHSPHGAANGSFMEIHVDVETWIMLLHASSWHQNFKKCVYWTFPTSAISCFLGSFPNQNPKSNWNVVQNIPFTNWESMCVHPLVPVATLRCGISHTLRPRCVDLHLWRWRSDPQFGVGKTTCINDWDFRPVAPLSAWFIGQPCPP